MKRATMLRVVQVWPAKRLRRKRRDRVTLGHARRMIDELNRESLREGTAAWLRIDRRRGWFVIEFYDLICN